MYDEKVHARINNPVSTTANVCFLCFYRSYDSSVTFILQEKSVRMLCNVYDRVFHLCNEKACEFQCLEGLYHLSDYFFFHDVFCQVFCVNFYEYSGGFVE